MNKEIAESLVRWNKYKDYKSNYKKSVEKIAPKYPPRNEGDKYPTPNPKDFQLFNCQGWGHKANECPNHRNLFLREGKLYYLGEEVRLEEDDNDEKS